MEYTQGRLRMPSGNIRGCLEMIIIGWLSLGFFSLIFPPICIADYLCLLNTGLTIIVLAIAAVAGASTLELLRLTLELALLGN